MSGQGAGISAGILGQTVGRGRTKRAEMRRKTRDICSKNGFGKAKKRVFFRLKTPILPGFHLDFPKIRTKNPAFFG